MTIPTIQKRVNGETASVEIVVTEPRRPPVTKISYTRRFALASYEFEEMTIEATLDDSAGSPEQELLAIRQLVAENCTTRLQQKARAQAQNCAKPSCERTS